MVYSLEIESYCRGTFSRNKPEQDEELAEAILDKFTGTRTPLYFVNFGTKVYRTEENSKKGEFYVRGFLGSAPEESKNGISAYLRTQ